jgi:hypothetical protein
LGSLLEQVLDLLQEGLPLWYWKREEIGQYRRITKTGTYERTRGRQTQTHIVRWSQNGTAEVPHDHCLPILCSLLFASSDSWVPGYSLMTLFSHSFALAVWFPLR